MVEEVDNWLDGEAGDDQLVGGGGEYSLSGGEDDDELGWRQYHGSDTTISPVVQGNR
jgi:Ca2+-binding RTX toxin-like protein